MYFKIPTQLNIILQERVFNMVIIKNTLKTESSFRDIIKT